MAAHGIGSHHNEEVRKVGEAGAEVCRCCAFADLVPLGTKVLAYGLLTHETSSDTHIFLETNTIFPVDLEWVESVLCLETCGKNDGIGID